MPRSAVPSQAQVEMLLESLEDRNWLATGYARTSHARDRTRAAWKEIAVKLNSDGSGCIKNWQQWSKYWKDKKSAVKKKASHIRMARQQTGGGALEEGLYLSAIEEKIVQIMGGERFASGDRELVIELILPPVNEPGPSFNLTPNAPDTIVEPSNAVVEYIPGEANGTQVSESILQNHVGLLPGEHITPHMLHTEQSTPSIPDVQPGPSRQQNMSLEQPNTEQVSDARSPSAVPHRRNASIASSSPRRRRILTARRRRIQHTPPSQRQSQMASLTERFIALEERRIDNQRQLIEVFREIPESWSRHTQALQDLYASLTRIN